MSYQTVKQSRGVRNNNPGNLKDFGIPWNGRKGADDRGFTIFDTMENGIRALTKDLKKDYFVDGQVTIRALITEFSATDQEAYIKYVSEQLGIGPDVVFDFNANVVNLVQAIIAFENGPAAVLVSQKTIHKGIVEAYV